MNLKIFAAAAITAAMLLPATSDAQSYRGSDRDRNDGRFNRPWRGHDRNWNQTRYDRVRHYDRYSNWPYAYPRDYRWPYGGRSYNLGTGRLWTPRGADVYYINGVRVYLPK